MVFTGMMVETAGWMARRSLAVVATTVIAGLGFWASDASAARSHLPVPFGFAGINIDYPVWPNPDIDLSQQFDVMAQSGVDSVRAVVDWAGAQPVNSPSRASSNPCGSVVDVGGITTDFTDTDALVAITAQHGMTLFPEVLDAPAWDGESFPDAAMDIPRTPGPYAAFVKALVLRYGSKGSFWRCNPQLPKVPVTMWQVWNEPNVYSFWPQYPRPYYAGYVPLLRAAHAAIKQADPSAKVVLAGLANYSWIDLARIENHGGRGLFDVVDVHPYTRTPQGVLTILGYARQVLNRAGGARIPILAGELSWPSSEGKGAVNVGFNIGTTEAGQAKDLATLLPLLARNRRRLALGGFYYFDWAGLERHGAEAFDFSGLFRYSQSTYQFYAKPAYYAYRADALWMEGCRAKSLLATECLR